MGVKQEANKQIREEESNPVHKQREEDKKIAHS
jgi:hypothetical protein